MTVGNVMKPVVLLVDKATLLPFPSVSPPAEGVGSVHQRGMHHMESAMTSAMANTVGLCWSWCFSVGSGARSWAKDWWATRTAPFLLRGHINLEYLVSRILSQRRPS